MLKLLLNVIFLGQFVCVSTAFSNACPSRTLKQQLDQYPFVFVAKVGYQEQIGHTGFMPICKRTFDLKKNLERSIPKNIIGISENCPGRYNMPPLPGTPRRIENGDDWVFFAKIKDGTSELLEMDSCHSRFIGDEQNKISTTEDYFKLSQTKYPEKSNRVLNFGLHDINLKGNGLTNGSIVAVFRTNHNQLRECGNKVESGTQGIEGDLIMNVLISKDGSVRTVNIQSTTIKNADLKSCITSRIAKWVFPKPKGNLALEFTFKISAVKL